MITSKHIHIPKYSSKALNGKWKRLINLIDVKGDYCCFIQENKKEFEYRIMEETKLMIIVKILNTKLKIDRLQFNSTLIDILFL